MPDPTTYNRFTLRFVSPYAREDTETKQWSLKFSMSGEPVTTLTVAEETAMDLANPVLSLLASVSSYVGFLYYAPGSDVNSFQAVYDPGTYPGNGEAYADGGETHNTQLEVVALCRASVGPNSKGRANYLMKHIHGIGESNTSPGTLGALTGTPLAAWSTGCGPNDLVTVDPTHGTASAAWTIAEALYTRQLRRGQKAPS